ncbi:MAG TPA: TIGR02266 family protein [Thermoanaerobaculia bacterium]|nr:TIGR02266 family protein [Thermoanaerobaculia bacterium]
MGSDQQEVWGRWASSTDHPDRDDPSDKAVTDYSNSPRDSTRVPLAHRIQLKFDRFSGFINEYFSNLSPGGIFIRTDTPEPPGQLLDFEFRLGDGYELIHGRGEVVWARERGEGPERPPGMGVRFIELSPGSKDLIYKIVDDYVAHGGKPFDLTAPTQGDPPPVPPGLGDEAPVQPGRGSEPPVQAAAAGFAVVSAAERLGQPPLGSAPAGSSPQGSTPLGSSASGPVPGSPPAAGASPPVAASPPAAGQSALPWTLELPAIQQLPGVPAITPRSPLESLGAGAAATTFPSDPGEQPRSAMSGFPSAAGEQALGSLSGMGEGAAREPTALILGDAVHGQAADPLAQMAAALPPLDELAPEVPALPPAPAATAVPSFSSFDLRATRRRSRMPLLGILTAIALLGLAVYLLRDKALAWIERFQEERSEGLAAVTPAAPSIPQAPGALPRRRGAGAASRGTLPAPPAGPAAAALPATGAAGIPGAPPASVPIKGPPATAAPAGGSASAGTSAPSAAGAAPPSGATAATAGGAAPAPAGSATSPSGGRAVLEPVATAGAGRTAGEPAAVAGARVTAIERISWQASGDGTDVVLWGNGEFTGQTYSHERIGGSPVREVVRITGIDRPYPSPRLAVGTPELLQIRTGYHPPRDLHIVLDLGKREVQVTAIEAGPRQLHIHLRAK